MAKRKRTFNVTAQVSCKTRTGWNASSKGKLPGTPGTPYYRKGRCTLHLSAEEI